MSGDGRENEYSDDGSSKAKDASMEEISQGVQLDELSHTNIKKARLFL